MQDALLTMLRMTVPGTPVIITVMPVCGRIMVPALIISVMAAVKVSFRMASAGRGANSGQHQSGYKT